MSVQIFTSNLEPINPSLDKITQRYVLKPNILILAYYHSKLRRTDSKCLADARVCRITIRFVLFLFIYGNSYFSSLMFDIVLVCRRPSQHPPMSFQIFIAAAAATTTTRAAAAARSRAGCAPRSAASTRQRRKVRARRHPAAAAALHAALS